MRNTRSVAISPSLMDDILDARAIWTEHIAVIGPTAMELVADIGKLAVELANSRLGQRARRYPEISFAVGAIALGMVSKMMRFR